MSEQVFKVEVVECVCMPERDPYTGGESQPTLWIDPTSRCCGISEEYQRGGTDADVYHMRTISELLPIRPSRGKARNYLESAEAQTLLDTVCAEHDISWDGHNMVGSLSDLGQMTLETIIYDLENLPESEWALWSVDDWLGQADLEITAGTTDEELEILAEQLEREATEDQVILAESVIGYLREQRDNQRD